MRLELPKDQWAELRDADDVGERLRRPLAKLMLAIHEKVVAERGELEEGEETSAKFGLAEFDDLHAMSDLAIVAFVSSWSFELPITVESLGELSGPVYDRLRAATSPMTKDLAPDFSPDTDKETPTGA